MDQHLFTLGTGSRHPFSLRVDDAARGRTRNILRMTIVHCHNPYLACPRPHQKIGFVEGPDHVTRIITAISPTVYQVIYDASAQSRELLSQVWIRSRCAAGVCPQVVAVQSTRRYSAKLVDPEWLYCIIVNFPPGGSESEPHVSVLL